MKENSTPEPRAYPRAAWWVLLGTGGTSITFGVWYALHHGHLNVVLALLIGVVPVSIAVALSHIVAEHRHGHFGEGQADTEGRLLATVTYLVMVGAMVLSIRATASVIKPVLGGWACWLFGAVLDVAALAVLRIILAGRSRAASAATALAQARAGIEAAQAAAVKRASEVERLASELAAAQQELADMRTRQPAPSTDAEVLHLTPGVHPRRTSVPPRSRTSGTAVESAGAADPLTEFADELVAGTVPGIRAIKARMHVGQAAAERIKAELEAAMNLAAPQDFDREPVTAAR